MSKPASKADILEFGSECLEKYGIKFGICDNSKDIYFPELRKACESNSCSVYGKCHTCPPDIGSAEECIKRALDYSSLLVFQKVFTIEDSFDYYGMLSAKTEFAKTQHKIAELARSRFSDIMILGAGGCNYCERCTKIDDLPCRFKDKAISSLEAHCIQVSHLSKLVGLNYINGQNTITYFGAVFFK